MRHLRYFLFFSGMLFLLTGCRPDYEQALDNMQATERQHPADVCVGL